MTRSPHNLRPVVRDVTAVLAAGMLSLAGFVGHGTIGCAPSAPFQAGSPASVAVPSASTPASATDGSAGDGEATDWNSEGG
ncbi:hypothetical protein [Streptomyces tendae]|uniref:CAP domain-containing protein n=1 Tax=Streptomyces tendae TaxID=1932 RepID=A0ABX6A1G6_STRTE|nr:hypothetical protein [Streptomyces tendae]QER90448.1 hypothetical protein F3L20_32790 [Streptomyces tendae]